MFQLSERWQRAVVSVAILHVVVLFLLIPAAAGRLKASYNQNQFADGYDLLAANLVAGHGYRFYPDTAQTLMREPGFPVFLAGVLLVAGSSMTTVKIVNLIMALVAAWLTIRLAQRVVPDMHKSHALLLGIPPILVLVSPGILIAESRGGVEILFGLLVALFILTLYRAIASNRLSDYVVSGAVLGLTVLVRSTPMLFPLFLLPYLLFFEGGRVSRLVICRNVVAMIVTMLIFLSPWVVRNYSLTGKIVPTASVLGVSAQAGQYINTHLFEGRPWWLLDREASRERDKIAVKQGYPFEDGLQGYYQTFYQPGDEIKFSSYLFHDVVSNYWNSPMLFLRCVGQNFFNFWFAGKTWMATTTNVVAQLPYLILSGMGIAFCVKRRQLRSLGPLLLFICYFWAVHLPILAQARYSIPLIPLLSIPGAVGLISILRSPKVAPMISKPAVVSST
ncbi:MAG: glycosyltransferase family 39 protein [Terracidiphilus sp.]